MMRPPAALSLAAPDDLIFAIASPPLICVSRCFFRLYLRGSFGISSIDLLNRIIARKTLSASASPRKWNALSTMPNPEEGARSETGGIDGSSQARVPSPNLAGESSPSNSNSDGGVVLPEHADTGLSLSRSIAAEQALLWLSPPGSADESAAMSAPSCRLSDFLGESMGATGT